jgi:hypothetical protein
MSNLTDEQMIQVRINTAVDEALSARDKEWKEKIEKYHDKVPFHNFTVYMTEDEWQSLLSQMNDTKRLKELNPEQKEYNVDNEPTFPICGTCMCEEEQTSQIIARATKEVEELISIGEKMTEQKEQKPVFVENMPTVNTPPLSTQSNSQEKPDSLLLSDEEIRNIFDRAIDVLIDSGIVLDDIMPEIKDCIKAELKHLEKLGIVYVKVPDYFCNKDNIRYFKVCDLHFEADPTGEYCINCPNLGKGVKHILISEYRKENEK